MTSHLSVRTASFADCDGVTRLLTASYPALMRDAYDVSTLDAVLPKMTVAQPALLSSGSYYVAETKNGMIVGCGGWTKECPGSEEVLPEVGHIRHFGVHPDCVRRGVGRAILTRCVESAKSAGIRRLECYSSLNGESFYSAFGFEKLGLIDIAIQDAVRFPSVRMRAEI